MGCWGIYCKFIDKKNPFSGCASSDGNAISCQSKIQSDKDFSDATRNTFVCTQIFCNPEKNISYS